MKKIFSALMILGLSAACAFNSDSDNDQNAKYQKENQKLEDKFSNITGTYKGAAQAINNSTLPTAPKEIEVPLLMAFYVDYQTVGKDQNGQPIMQPTLKLRFRQEDIVRSDDILLIQYTQETGDLQGDNSDTTNNRVMLRGRLTGNQISGYINRGAGRLGNFVVTLQTKDVPMVTSPYEDYVNRLHKQNQSVEGTYIGRVTGKEGGNIKDFPVKLVLSAEKPVEGGITVARLTGRYSRLDFQDPSIGARFFQDVSFSDVVSPIELSMSSQGGTPNMPNSYKMNIYGVMQNGVFEGSMEDSLGKGKIKVVLQKR